MRCLTNLEYLLLFQLHQQPASGYSLRKAFASTPLGYYSDSPGSIYPALQRLRRRGLIRPTQNPSPNGRRTQLFAVTPKALAELRAWVHRLITLEEVRNDPPALMLRFVICAQLFGEVAAHKFLVQLQSRLNEIILELESYVRGPAKTLPLAGRLAVEQGLAGYRTLSRWATHASQELARSSS
jgi:DNA-binding PadR family transcriptional regulator